MTGTMTGAVQVVSAGAIDSPKVVSVRLTLVPVVTSAGPFGSFDTPADGASGLQGSIAVTGWALDDIEVDRVELWRDLAAGETTGPFNAPGHPGHGKVFLANAAWVSGSRPDVETAYPRHPVPYRAGWGYLLLTQGLWRQGNGTYTLYAVAFDKEGRSRTLGSKTIGVNNQSSTKPFGTVDTPTLGQIVSGSLWSYGWALTPKPNAADGRACSIGNGNVFVAIDSGPLRPVVYGETRPDIAASFAGFSNGARGGGAYHLDTTALSNGVHQIGWLVTDNCGRSEGIGSRFFTVLNDKE
jgi:hypothetical protein